jgi:predicted ribosome quality control (RQC) complex YloA/Tae2 family protein
MPTLGSVHAEVAIARAGLHPRAGAASLNPSAIERLAAAAMEVDRAASTDPRPHLTGAGPDREVALVPAPAGSWTACDTVEEAVRIWATGRLARQRVTDAYAPVIAALERASEKLERSAAEIQAELARPSRADVHERNAHLLMASAAGRGAGASSITVPDVLASGDAPPVTIALDPALTAVANAERLYDRARRARRAREQAAERGAEAGATATRAAELLAEARALEAAGALPKELNAWIAAHAVEMDRLVRTGSSEGTRLPYRQFMLAGGWEARVGRGAKDNQELTTRHASPHDYWLHARGVSGSHVVLRRPSRDAKVPRPVLEAAAGLAAWFSKARSQALVPVSYTERKYVRPVKGGPPGLVRLEREEVVMVEPRSAG